MITIEMKKKTFTVLNLTDFQLLADEWTDKTDKGRHILSQIDTLIKENEPDLITLSGDIAWGGDFSALSNMASVFDGYKIPWAPVFGNHDHDRGIKTLDKSIELLKKYQYFTYENGPSELGRGNYVIGVSNGKNLVHAIFMMDTHEREEYIDESGDTKTSWSKLTTEQIAWYKGEVEKLKTLGVNESSIIIHIPIYAYNYAWECAHNKEYDEIKITPNESHNPKYWNEGYSDSFGVKYEPITGYSLDDGVFEHIKALDHTKNVISGHNHVNNFSINYQGVRLSFATKTGMGSYYNPLVNGGSILSIDKDGKATFKHHYLEIT